MMNPGIIIAISILTAIFFGALIILIVVIRKKQCKSFDGLTEYYHPESALDQNLVENMELPCDDVAAVELEEVSACERNERFYEDEAWRESIVDLLPHCLEILETTYILTDKIVRAASMESKDLEVPEYLSGFGPLAKKVGMRVDEVVRSMYPPLDPRLLEARCSALALSVNHLLLLAKSTLHIPDYNEWTDHAMANVEGHLKVLRKASMLFEKHLFKPESSGNLEVMAEMSEDVKMLDLQPQSCLVTSSAV